MDSGRSPSLLATNQAAFLCNATNRDGFVRTRPRFKNFTLNFEGEEDAEDHFMSHAISGQTYYSPPNGTPLLMCCCGGRFYTLNIIGNQAIVSDVTVPNDSNNQYLKKTWFEQAAQYMVAQNGSDGAYIFDGTTGRRSDILNNEIPSGRQMAYINGRLAVVLPNAREISIGDLAYVTSTSVLEFTEILRPAIDGGQPLSVPIENGPITALVATAQMDTTAGQGVLLAASAKSISTFNPIIQRSQWPNITLQSIALIGNGFLNSDLAIVNGDVWGRSIDGWRSFIMARREFSTWGNRVQSQEVKRILNLESPQILANETFVYFDNRLLGCCTPMEVSGGIYHKGIIALNFEGVSSITQTSTPAYDGLWTGLQPYGLVVGAIEGYERCFAFCRNRDGRNSLWEITKEYGHDDGGESGTPIAAFMESRSFTFGSPVRWKQLQSSELWIDQLDGSVSFDLRYRPDQLPCWFSWWTGTECATMSDCETLDEFGCLIPTTFRSQYRSRINIGSPEDDCNDIDDTNSRFGYEFQIRLAWTGNCRIRTFVLYADLKDVDPTLNCPS